MQGLQWYPRYAGDYIRKTRHLSMLEHGAYNLLLDHYYATGKPIGVSNASLMPDHSRVYRLCGAIEKHEREAVDSVLEMFFELTDDGYINTKAAEVIEKQRAAHERRVNAGRKGGKQSPSNAKAKPEQSPRNPEPEPEVKDIYIEGCLHNKDTAFDLFWSLYPSGKPKGNRAKAKDKFTDIFKLMTKGEIDHETFIRHCKEYRTFCDRGDNYNQHAVTWLNQRGWETDWASQTSTSPNRPPARPGKRQSAGGLDEIIDAGEKAKEMLRGQL